MAAVFLLVEAHGERFFLEVQPGELEATRGRLLGSSFNGVSRARECTEREALAGPCMRAREWLELDTNTTGEG